MIMLSIRLKACSPKESTTMDRIRHNNHREAWCIKDQILVHRPVLIITNITNKWIISSKDSNTKDFQEAAGLIRGRDSPCKCSSSIWWVMPFRAHLELPIQAWCLIRRIRHRLTTVEISSTLYLKIRVEPIRKETRAVPLAGRVWVVKWQATKQFRRREELE